MDKKYWDNKMSRVRFHAIDAIGRHDDVLLVKDGPGFPGWLSAEHSKNINNPDCVLWYKPLEINGYEKVKCKKIISYNEMYDIKSTKKEILDSNSDIIICHLANDIKHYSDINKRFVNIPHCIEKSIFKDWEQPKDIDILIAGIQSPGIYPLRYRFMKMIERGMFSGFKTKILNHPGYRIKDVNSQVLNYAKILNRSKIMLSCTSVYKYALAKHIEAPASKTLMISDLPDERNDIFNLIMEPVDPKWSDDKMVSIVTEYLKNKEKLNNKVNSAYDYVHNNLTQEHYANMFYNIASEN